MTTGPAPRPEILNIHPYVAGESSIAGANRTIKLSSNEGAFGVPPGAQAAIQAAVRKGIMRKDGKWSSRSLRAGGATALQRLGYGELEAQALGGWKSKALYYYLRRQALADKKLSTHMFALTNE